MIKSLYIGLPSISFSALMISTPLENIVGTLLAISINGTSELSTRGTSTTDITDDIFFTDKSFSFKFLINNKLFLSKILPCLGEYVITINSLVEYLSTVFL